MLGVFGMTLLRTVWIKFNHVPADCCWAISSSMHNGVSLLYRTQVILIKQLNFMSPKKLFIVNFFCGTFFLKTPFKKKFQLKKFNKKSLLLFLLLLFCQYCCIYTESYEIISLFCSILL